MNMTLVPERNGGLWGTERGQSSSLPSLHIGGNGSSGCKALEALICVVDEDPVLVLIVGLCVVAGGCRGWRGWRGKTQRKEGRTR